MTRKIVTVSPGAPLIEVTKIFDKNNFHHIPVVEKGNRLVGIISSEDFQKMNFFFYQKRELSNGSPQMKEGLCAVDLMTPCPLSVSPEDSLGLAADVFLANRFHALPVIDDDRLVGIITSHDLITYAYKSAIETPTDNVPIGIN